MLRFTSSTGRSEEERENGKRDGTCLVGLVGHVQSRTFPNIRQSVRDITSRVMFWGFCSVPPIRPCLLCEPEISVQYPFNMERSGKNLTHFVSSGENKWDFTWNKVSVEGLWPFRYIKLVETTSKQNIKQFIQSVTTNFDKMYLGSKLTAVITEEVKWYLC